MIRLPASLSSEPSGGLSASASSGSYQAPVDVYKRQRLDRYRKHNFDGWKANDDRRPREAGYLYQLRAVKTVVEELRASSQRPAK